MEFSRADSRTEETYRIHGYWLPVELHERLKNAWWWTRVEVDGVPTFGALMERIMRGECVRLEGAYRGGERFEAAPKNAQGLKSSAPFVECKTRNYWLPVELHERLKNAWWWTRVEVDGVPTFGALMERIMRGECVRLEGAYRGGERFEAAPKNARGVKPDASKRQSEKLIARWALIRQEEQNGPKNP